MRIGALKTRRKDHGGRYCQSTLAFILIVIRLSILYSHHQFLISFIREVRRLFRVVSKRGLSGLDLVQSNLGDFCFMSMVLWLWSYNSNRAVEVVM